MERTFYAFARRNLAYDKRRIQTTVTLGNNNAFVSLQTLAGTFLNLNLYQNGVAWPPLELRLRPLSG